MARSIGDLVAGVLLVLVVHSAAHADEAKTTFSCDLVAIANPAGVALVPAASHRWKQDDGASVLLAGRYREVGVAMGVNPAYAQASLWTEWVPIAPLQLRAQYDVYGFFGANGALLRLPSADSPFGSGVLDALAGAERSGLGQRVLLSPVLRARFGRLIVRNQTDLAWYAVSSDSGVYYEWEYDTLVERRDWIVSNRTTLMFEFWKGSGESGLLVGPGYEITNAQRTGVARRRLGAVAFWSPTERLWGLRQPRLFAWSGVNLQDRNRDGEFFILLGAGFDIDR